jgi:acetyltransferase
MPETIIIPHPTHRANYITTRSGLVIEVVPATEHDAPALARFFDAVSEEDRRFRFLAACQHVSEEQIETLTHPDHFRTESFLAFEPVNGDLVASAMLACDGALDTAEVAVSIVRITATRGSAGPCWICWHRRHSGGACGG